MVRVYFSLGSNMGDSVGHLQTAARALADALGGACRCSSIYRTAPHNAPAQPDFMNMVIECETSLSPDETLRLAMNVEQAHGRVRDGGQGPRTLDVDILMHGDALCDTADLTLPHPRMEERAFVLVPLNEIAPFLRLPSGRTAGEALALVGWQRVELVREAPARVAD